MALQPLRGPFTVDTYLQLGELGLLHEDDRVELIDGQVVEMSPIGNDHASCVRRLNGLFARALLDRAVIDVQNPIVLGERDSPKPDVTLLRPRGDGYPRHPRAADILLLVEVADTSLAYDREVKVPLYARAGVPEVWVIDLASDRIHLWREPAGDHYASARTVSRNDTITPVSFADVAFSVDEIVG
jgi:Uma2 family endonuclease